MDEGVKDRAVAEYIYVEGLCFEYEDNMEEAMERFRTSLAVLS